MSAYTIALIPAFTLGAFPGFFAAIQTLLLRKYGDWSLLAAPLVWAGSEFLRFHLTGIGWNCFGYSQAFQTAIVWPSKFGGVYLISALLVLLPAAVLITLKKRNSPQIATVVVALLLCLTVYLAGKESTVSAEATPSSNAISAVAVQAVAPVGGESFQKLRESFKRYKDITRENVAKLKSQKPVLVIWPETPFNFDYELDTLLRLDFEAFVRENNINLMFNVSTETNTGSRNSVILINNQGERLGKYDKIHLMPFGEYVPMRKYLPFDIPVLAGDFQPGTDYSVMKLENLVLGASICWEAAFPDVTRQQSLAGANVLVNVADDAWFGNTPEPRQHLAHIVLRTVETGLPMYRVTNSGITARIRPNGQVLDETALFQNAWRIWQIEASSAKPTFYVQYGDIFAILSLLFTTVFLVLPKSIFAKRRKDARRA